MPRYQFSQDDARKGGQSTARKRVTAWQCPRCGKQFCNTTQLTISGHSGLHHFADRYAGGSLRQAALKLSLCGQAAADPFPANAAFSQAQATLAEVRAQRAAWESEEKDTAPA